MDEAFLATSEPKPSRTMRVITGGKPPTGTTCLHGSLSNGSEPARSPRGRPAPGTRSGAPGSGAVTTHLDRDT